MMHTAFDYKKELFGGWVWNGVNVLQILTRRATLVRYWERSNWQISFDNVEKGHTGGFLVAGMMVQIWLYSAYRLACNIIINTSDSRRVVTYVLVEYGFPYRATRTYWSVPLSQYCWVHVIISINNIYMYLSVYQYLFYQLTSASVFDDNNKKTSITIRFDEICTQAVDGLGLYPQLWRGELMQNIQICIMSNASMLISQFSYS